MLRKLVEEETGIKAKSLDETIEESCHLLVHIYQCNPCKVTFSVTQCLEDQSAICCPNCKEEEDIADIGSGEIIRRD